MTTPLHRRRKPHPFWRSLVEVASIVFLFYSNLLMGEFTGNNSRGKSLSFAVRDIFALANVIIADEQREKQPCTPAFKSASCLVECKPALS